MRDRFSGDGGVVLVREIQVDVGLQRAVGHHDPDRAARTVGVLDRRIAVRFLEVGEPVLTVPAIPVVGRRQRRGPQVGRQREDDACAERAQRLREGGRSVGAQDGATIGHRRAQLDVEGSLDRALRCVGDHRLRGQVGLKAHPLQRRCGSFEICGRRRVLLRELERRDEVMVLRRALRALRRDQRLERRRVAQRQMHDRTDPDGRTERLRRNDADRLRRGPASRTRSRRMRHPAAARGNKRSRRSNGGPPKKESHHGPHLRAESFNRSYRLRALVSLAPSW